jgi:DHA1 family tetracycline resistance protein-like MFS transporter
MLLGTVLFTQVFGWFTSPDSPVYSAGAAYLLAATILTATLVFFLTLREANSVTRQ